MILVNDNWEEIRDFYDILTAGELISCSFCIGKIEYENIEY